MRVEVEREVATKMINVYVIEDGMDGGSRVWTPTEREDWTLVPLGGVAPVSLRVPEAIWAAMAAAGSDVPIPSRAQHDHLADTIAVRDRLLALVEAGYLSAVPDGKFFGSRE